MNQSPYRHLPVLPHAGYLGELRTRPAYLSADAQTEPDWPFYCGGLHGEIQIQQNEFKSEIWEFKPGNYLLRCYYLGQFVERKARLDAQGLLETQGAGLISGRSGVFLAELERDGESWTLLLREYDTRSTEDGYTQSFQLYRTVMQRTDREIHTHLKRSGSARLRIGMGENRSLFPLQLMPSVLDVTGRRIALHYSEAIERLADLLLAHRPPYGRTFVYADESVDYFGIFALQEVGRLLGMRNLYGSVIWGAQAVGQGDTLQRGNEAPLLNPEQALNGKGRLFLLNGWNGFITHLPLFERLLEIEDLDAWLISVMTTETAKVLASKLGAERILLIKPGSESMLALAIAHELLKRYPEAVNQDRLKQVAEDNSLQEYLSLAQSEIFRPEQVAPLIVPEPSYESRLLQGIQVIAERLAQADSVPIHVPGAELIQSGGMAAYCLWNNLLALTGKLGCCDHSEIRGGELRVITQGNEESQLQGLGPNQFFGCLPLDEEGAKEAALRMQLPDDAYQALLKEPIRPIMDFPEPNQSHQRELILCIGTGLEAQFLRDHERWRERLRSNETTLVVIDPMPGPFLLKHAALCLPTPPTVARHQLTLNGEWRLVQSFPRRQAPSETRTESSILYDTMAEISRSLRESESFRQGHPDLARHLQDGYLQVRFESPDWGWGGQLKRIDGEVSRAQLWDRIQDYLGPQSSEISALFCQPRSEQAEQTEQATPASQADQTAQAEPLSWTQLLQAGICLLSPKRPQFANLKAEAVPFRFFVPKEADFAIPAGLMLNIGSAIPDPEPAQVRFAIQASGSGHTQLSDEMPTQRWLYVSRHLATEHQLKDGDIVALHHSDAAAVICPIQISDWLKGSMVYFHHYMTQQELSGEVVIPWLRFKVETCAYSQVPLLKKVQIQLAHSQEAESNG